MLVFDHVRDRWLLGHSKWNKQHVPKHVEREEEAGYESSGTTYVSRLIQIGNEVQ